MYESEKVFSDMVVEDMEALPLTQPHRLIDSIVTEADTEGAPETLLHSVPVSSTRLQDTQGLTSSSLLPFTASLKTALQKPVSRTPFRFRSRT